MSAVLITDHAIELNKGACAKYLFIAGSLYFTERTSNLARIQPD